MAGFQLEPGGPTSHVACAQAGDGLGVRAAGVELDHVGELDQRLLAAVESVESDPEAGIACLNPGVGTTTARIPGGRLGARALDLW